MMNNERRNDEGIIMNDAGDTAFNSAFIVPRPSFIVCLCLRIVVVNNASPGMQLKGTAEGR
jgi:hypothetical protein